MRAVGTAGRTVQKCLSKELQGLGLDVELIEEAEELS
jgi:hypothetical protein